MDIFHTSSSFSTALPPRSRPKTTDPSFIGRHFKNGLSSYAIQQKSASKRGTTSWIWDHGAELWERFPPRSKQAHWVCHLRWDKGKTVVRGTSSTTPAIDHMKKDHEMNSDSLIMTEPKAPFFGTQERPRPTTVLALVTQVDVNSFGLILLRWICIAHIALSCVESEEFRALIGFLNPSLCDFLYESGTSIKALLLRDFEKRKERLKQDLKHSKSKIHISFDLWTSPNKLAMLGIVVHYLAWTGKARSVLLALRQLIGPHSGENQAVIILEIVKEFDFANVGYHISDNVTSNDCATFAICRDLGLGSPTACRLRCLGHVVNLVAKALLFGEEEGAFDFEVSELAKLRFEVRQALETLVFWRKKGPLGKLHNIILSI